MDASEPSTNGVSASNLYRLASLLGDDKYEALAKETVGAFEAEIMQYPWLFGSFMPSVVAGVTGVRAIVRVGAGEPDVPAVTKSVPVAPVESGTETVEPEQGDGAEKVVPPVPAVVPGTGAEKVVPAVSAVAPVTGAEPSIPAAADASTDTSTDASTGATTDVTTDATTTTAPTTTDAPPTSTPTSTATSSSTPSLPTPYHPVALDTTPSGGLVEAGETPHPAPKAGTRLPPWPRPRAKGGIETVCFVGGGYGAWIGGRNGYKGLVGGGERVLVCEGGGCREVDEVEGVW